jgi:ribonuclease HI
MSKSGKKIIIVYTDGSCMGNGRSDAVGGIGIHFPNKELKDISKIYCLGLCTNQKTELYAILTAIRYIKKNLSLNKYKVIIKTDSQYSINCVTKWINGWMKNGWITQNNKPVLNRKMIETIHKYYTKYDIEFNYVEAHTDGNDEESIANAIADKLATDATKKAYEKMKTEKKLKNNARFYGSKTDKMLFTPRKFGDSYNDFSTGNFIVELVKSSK